ncbi:hypothetical protein B0T22DRAFT_451103 [Podospora appendiculata]|uniref:Uncharacterized protein n=1 Tax=Podospora appendiculata TaxID=314037 RepID=A0AAE0XI68_9PEZI|nr:hypothetical protein B0T22DRAFT_451103 [Podospora appendiculata]
MFFLFICVRACLFAGRLVRCLVLAWGLSRMHAWRGWTALHEGGGGGITRVGCHSCWRESGLSCPGVDMMDMKCNAASYGGLNRWIDGAQ